MSFAGVISCRLAGCTNQGLKFLHREGRIRIRGLDVATLSHRNIRVPQNPLDHLIRHAQPIQIRC